MVRRLETARRIRHELQMAQSGLDAGVAQPPAEAIDGYPVQQHMMGETVPECVSPDATAVSELARLGSTQHSLVHPPPSRWSGYVDHAARANGAETCGRGRGGLHIRMYQKDAGFPAFSPADPQSAEVGV